MKPVFSVVALMIFLAACSPLIGVEAVSVVNTDKTLGDHIISFSSGKDCSTIRKQRGMTYCKEDEIQAKTSVFCYRTLAEVTCYERPVFEGKQERVGENPSNDVR